MRECRKNVPALFVILVTLYDPDRIEEVAVQCSIMCCDRVCCVKNLKALCKSFAKKVN